MTTIKDNTIFDKTSFLEGSNSAFIKELYLKYVDNPSAVPESWKELSNLKLERTFINKSHTLPNGDDYPENYILWWRL